MKIKNITKEQVVDAIDTTETLEDASEVLGINRKSLYKLRKKFGLFNYNKCVSKQVQLELDFEGKKEVEEEKVNLNLKKLYTGRFKEKTDITHKVFKKFVITSVQNDTEVDRVFYESLKNYCLLNNAKLLVVPVYYNYSSNSRFNVEEDDLFFDNIQLSNSLKLLSNLKILPTIVDPFAGIDTLSKGDSIVIPHPQVSMKTMSTLGNKPAQMYTTGSLSLKDSAYAKNKTGYKAEFNHSNAALIVELGNNDSFHIRGLNCDNDSGFFDITGYYKGNEFTELTSIEAIYLGDTHVSVADDKVIKATFLDDDSIVKRLKPKIIIHGDLFDAGSVSHHDNNDYLVRVAKALTGNNNLKNELKQVGDFLRKTTPINTKVLINASNHNDHLYKWLTTNDCKNDLVNSEIYHYLNYLMIKNIKKVPSGISFPNLLELWFKHSDFKDCLNYSEFLGRREGYKIKDIEISMHGDKGTNGSKGSPNSFSRLPTKCIVGHSHSPSIRLGCYTVGTSSLKDLSYTGGPSSWMHSHCIIYSNGKRQMINIINGKWFS